MTCGIFAGTMGVSIMRVGDTTRKGFTVVEMLVTVVLAGMFLTFFIQMFRATTSQQASVTRLSTAGDIALSNLNKFPSASAVPGYTCDDTTVGASNPNNLKLNPSASGVSILDDTTKEPDPGTLGTLEQSVRAYSPNGCSAVSSVVKLVSTVKYNFGGQQQEVTHVTYVY